MNKPQDVQRAIVEVVRDLTEVEAEPHRTTGQSRQQRPFPGQRRAVAEKRADYAV